MPDTNTQEAGDEGRYFVVFRTLVGPSKGAVTFSSFKDADAFKEWYGKNMQDGSDMPLKEAYAVVKEGVSLEEAQRIIAENRMPNWQRFAAPDVL